MKRTLLILLLLLAACGEKDRPKATSQDSLNNQIAQIDLIEKNLVPVHYLRDSDPYKSILQHMQEDVIPGVSMAFIDHGAVSWQRTYGYANLEDSVRVNSSTVFNGASLSKPVTAMAALDLVEERVLSVDEDVNTYLRGWQVPDNPFTKEEKVTLKRLMGHTAGFDRYVQSSFFPHETLPTITQMLAGEAPSVDPPVSLVYVPGQKQIYSNPGYSVMEKLIEDVTGKDFNAVLTERIFEPSGMIYSSFEQPVPDRLSQQMATGYSNDLEPYPYKLFPYKAAGGIWTTPTDLAKFLGTLLEDHQTGRDAILSQTMADSVFSKSSTRWGFAKIYNDESPDVLIEHWGSNSGFTCYMVASHVHRQGLVIMTNSDNGMSLMSYITRAVAAAYGWDFFQPKVLDPMVMDSSLIKAFVGKYKGGDELLEFDLVAGSLSFSRPSGLPKRLVTVAENQFVSPDNNTLFEFLENQAGEVKYVRMTWADGYNSDYIRQ